MRTRVPNYKSYADANIDRVSTPKEMKGLKQLTANYLSIACFISNCQGNLHSLLLPLPLQYFPVYTITPFNYDHDGNEEMLLCGNINHKRLCFGKYDTNYDLLVKRGCQG